jgi:hypothetical protein
LVDRLPPADRDDFLIRLAEGDPSAGLALRKRLAAFLPQEQRKAAHPRTVQQLVERAKALRQADQVRRAEEKRKKHLAEMRALAAREPQVWQQVADLLAKGVRLRQSTTKRPSCCRSSSKCPSSRTVPRTSRLACGA